MRAFALSLALVAAGPAGAGGLVFDAAPLAACVEAGGGAACIASAAHSCMDATPGGHSTMVMNGCLEAELDWWDEMLNVRYAGLVAAARAGDADMERAGIDKPADVAALRAMQRAWIDFRDASCEYEALQWWGGTGASGAYLVCRMTLTAEQALRLARYGDGE